MTNDKKLYEMINSYTLNKFKRLNEGEDISKCGKFSAIEKYGLDVVFESCCEDGNSEDAYIQKLKEPVEKALERISAKMPEKAKAFAETIKNAQKSGKRALKIALFAIILAANNINAFAAGDQQHTVDLDALKKPAIENVETKDALAIANVQMNTNSAVNTKNLIAASEEANKVADQFANNHKVKVVYSNYKEFPNEMKTKQQILDFVADIPSVKKDGYEKENFSIKKAIKYQNESGGTEYIFVVTLN